jgi:hypothetical protein
MSAIISFFVCKRCIRKLHPFLSCDINLPVMRENIGKTWLHVNYKLIAEFLNTALPDCMTKVTFKELGDIRSLVALGTESKR